MNSNVSEALGKVFNLAVKSQENIRENGTIDWDLVRLDLATFWLPVTDNEKAFFENTFSKLVNKHTVSQYTDLVLNSLRS